MMITRHKTIGLVLLGILVAAMLVFGAFQLGRGNLGLAASASPNSPAAISPGQKAAIEGAVQLLLLQPQQSQKVYLSLVQR